MDKTRSKLIGIIPAAGHASRISPIPCSKEIFPIGFQNREGETEIRVAASALLESFHEAMVDQVYMIIRKGKWDIPQYLGTGIDTECSLAYLVTDPTKGTHYTIDLAYRFVKDHIVLLGFPDILFKPQNAFTFLLEKLQKTGADIVLGLFEATNPQGADMLEIDPEGRLIKIDIKPEETSLKYTWIIAVWTPAFSEYLHEFVCTIEGSSSENNMSASEGEVFIGDVIRHALKDGLDIETVLFPEGEYTDIGTVPDLKQALNNGF